MSSLTNELTSKALTHLDAKGHVHMVDVGSKAHSKRVAVARGSIAMQAHTLNLLQEGVAKKGDVLATARVAAIMACKKTAELIPLCHPLSLSHVGVEFTVLPQERAVTCQVRCETTGPTGVEMEALTGVQMGLLTIYDMCKAVDKDMVISNVCLVQKTGGKSGDYQRETD